MTISDGRKINIRFTQPLVGNVLGLDPPIGYKKSKIDLTFASASALNEANSVYSASKAIDGNATGTSYWYGTTANTWLQVRLPQARVVTKIRLNLGSYYIRTFTFSGSNDGETWVQIGGTYTAASSDTQQWYDIAIENSDPYLYYRITTVTSYSSSTVILYEIELYEDVPIGNESKFTVSFDEYDMVPEGTCFRGTRPVSEVYVYSSVNAMVDTSSGSHSGIDDNHGVLSLAVDEGG